MSTIIIITPPPPKDNEPLQLESATAYRVRHQDYTDAQRVLAQAFEAGAVITLKPGP